jgi:hypothetical protein
MRRDTVWQQPELVRTFIEDVRGGVPYGSDQTARTILAQHPAARAVLVDFSEPMLAAAREALAAQRPAPAFVVGKSSSWRCSAAGAFSASARPPS